MAVVAHEPGEFIVLIHAVGGEIQPIRDVLPPRNEGGHKIVHGQIRVPVGLLPHEAEVPSPVVMRVSEVGEIEGFGGSDNEEISHSRIVIHNPVR
jgi:hypothetical protein